MAKRCLLLATVAHEVEASHQQNEIRKQQPVPLQSYLALSEERLGDAAPGFLGRPPHRLPLLVYLRLGEHQTVDNDQDGRACAEPEQRPPAVGRRVHQATGERGGEQVAKGVALLEHTAHKTTGVLREILEGGGGCVAIQTAHGDAEEPNKHESIMRTHRYTGRLDLRAAGEELAVILGEAGALRS